MKKYLLSVILYGIFLTGFGQEPIIEDLSKVLVEVDTDGKVLPITDFTNKQSIGLFLSNTDTLVARICNRYPMYLWSNGQMIQKIENCEQTHFKPLSNTGSEMSYFTLSSKNGFKDFSFHEVKQNKLIYKQKEEETKIKYRNSFSANKDFLILSILILLGSLGYIFRNFKNRLSFIFSESLSFSVSSIKKINIRFLRTENLLFFF